MNHDVGICKKIHTQEALNCSFTTRNSEASASQGRDKSYKFKCLQVLFADGVLRMYEIWYVFFFGSICNLFAFDANKISILFIGTQSNSTISFYCKIYQSIYRLQRLYLNLLCWYWLWGWRISLLVKVLWHMFKYLYHQQRWLWNSK